MTKSQQTMLRRMKKGESILHYGYKLCWVGSSDPVNVKDVVFLVGEKLIHLNKKDIFVFTLATQKSEKLKKVS